MDLKSCKVGSTKLNDASLKSNFKSSSSLGGSEITVKQFLDFLKTAYQVNDSVEGLLLADGLTDAVDWIKLKESELVKPREIACQTESTKKRSDISGSNGDAGDDIKRKLSEVLSEGIFDSILPYLMPPSLSSLPGSRRPSQQKLTISEKTSQSSVVSTTKRISERRKSSDNSISSKSANKIESDVVIHVCDEAKNAKKDFVCNQKLLVEKMGYFAEVTSGQRLEDMDISVHCDIAIFEWLICWIKKEELSEEEIPKLDSQCVIPVLVSSAFLQMEPLQQECLLYCHRHMNDILRTSTNLSCLNDSVMTRLAAMYTNTEVEAIRDRKDKIQSRLYCKLIKSLCEPETESMRGHWNSLARVFRCGRCQQLVNNTVGCEIPCVPACMRISCDGSVNYFHEIDSNWNINDYLRELQKSLKTWRKVYWHLWGDTHFLYCTVCKRYFPAHQIGWCRFHPDSPQYFTVEAQRTPLPIGRYPCCGEKAYRFEIIQRESGCQFRDHTPVNETVREAAVLSMLEDFRSLIEEEPPKLVFPERLTRLVSKASPNGDADVCDGIEGGTNFWWEGLELIPPRPKLGLLGSFGDTKSCLQKPNSPSPPPEAVTEDEEASDSDSSSRSESSSSDQKSEGSYRTPLLKNESCEKHTSKKRKERLWQQNLSARSNQDLQRCHEEMVLKQIASMLSRRTLLTDNLPRQSNRSWPRHIVPQGGVWVRLENEWRERNSFPQQTKFRNVFTGRNRIKTNRLN